MIQRALTITNGLLLVLFAWAAAVQYNDPEPILWTTIYGAGALCCGLYMVGQLRRWLAFVVSGACLGGALYLLVRVVGPIGFFDATGQEMMGLQEETRELFGLLIIALWTAVLGSRTHRSTSMMPSARDERR